MSDCQRIALGDVRLSMFVVLVSRKLGKNLHCTVVNIISHHMLTVNEVQYKGGPKCSL